MYARILWISTCGRLSHYGKGAKILSLTSLMHKSMNFITSSQARWNFCVPPFVSAETWHSMMREKMEIGKFFLGCRELGLRLGVSYKTASEHLIKLEEYEIIEVLSKGRMIGRQATDFKWLLARYTPHHHMSFTVLTMLHIFRTTKSCMVRWRKCFRVVSGRRSISKTVIPVAQKRSTPGNI